MCKRYDGKIKGIYVSKYLLCRSSSECTYMHSLLSCMPCRDHKRTSTSELQIIQKAIVQLLLEPTPQITKRIILFLLPNRPSKQIPSSPTTRSSTPTTRPNIIRIEQTLLTHRLTGSRGRCSPQIRLIGSRCRCRPPRTSSPHPDARRTHHARHSRLCLLSRLSRLSGNSRTPDVCLSACETSICRCYGSSGLSWGGEER